MRIQNRRRDLQKKFSVNGVLSYCVDGPCADEVMTNADRIRSMSDEELADFICSNFECKFCPISHIEDIWLEAVCDAQHGHEIEKLVEWLQQPAKEG